MSRAQREFLRELRTIQYRTASEVRHDDATLRAQPASQEVIASRDAAAQRQAVWGLIQGAPEAANGDDFAAAFTAVLRDLES